MTKKLSIVLSTLALAVATLGVSRDARALGPIDLEVGARVGYGSNPSGFAPNPLGVAIGGRVGVSFFGLYGGLSGQYNLGGTTQGQSGEGATGPQTLRSYQYGVDLGYGFKVPFIRLVVRPLVSIGNYVYTPSGSGYCSEGITCSSVNYLYLEPGVTAFFTFGRLFVGGDVNLFILPSVDTVDSSGEPAKTTDVALTAHAQIGVRF
jgi:hypothetical protein